MAEPLTLSTFSGGNIATWQCPSLGLLSFWGLAICGLCLYGLFRIPRLPSAVRTQHLGQPIPSKRVPYITTSSSPQSDPPVFILRQYITSKDQIWATKSSPYGHQVPTVPSAMVIEFFGGSSPSSPEAEDLKEPQSGCDYGV